ncbi:MAG: DNA mismatch repair endonuclease MutL [Candidatus Cloacimonetes bacterium]|nr:DNA mismatch repair endonuclease MutL [Candidatus Cloacimonadota bacterium]
MNKIHILTEDVRNKIAAGEVIERPVSVIKELVENSIDAQSTQISVAIENGGKDFIQVVDNGIGMSEDDALLAFERHSTSKIRNANDIIHINSLGFRGEALPSIASVSRLTLVTREENSDIATQIDFSDGKLLEMKKTSANKGTTITIKGLFKSIPARRKFLRSETAELKHIIKYFHYQSLLYPEITFKLMVNGKEKLHYKKAKDIQNRLGDVFGSKFFELDIIPINQNQEDMSISGYIFGLEEEKLSLLDEKYIFINGRYINDKTIYHSIRTAYTPFIAKTRVWAQGSTPPYLLFLNILPELIDFNVHPAKLEVRFRDQQLIHSFVKNAITSALSQYEEQKFQSAKQKFHHASAVNKATFVEKEVYKSRIDIPRYSSYKKELGNLYQTDLFKSEDKAQPLSVPIVNQEKALEQNQTELFPELPNDSISAVLLSKNEEDYVNPWQLHNSYVFIQVEDGLVVIDQHAAHERIIYEKMMQRTKGAPAVRQKLVFPLVIDIPPYIKTIIQEQLDENLALLELTGFKLKKFSGTSIAVSEIPAELDDWQGGKVFVEILKQLQEEMEENKDFRDSLAKSIACKAAIRAGKKLSKKEMLNLVNDLFACQIPYFCPHGRPLMIKMTLQEFEKRFKRIL